VQNLVKHQINCNHQDHTYKEYWSAKISKDHPLLLNSIKLCEDEYKNYNPHDPSGRKRTEQKRKGMCIYGKLAEHALRSILNAEIENSGVQASIPESKNGFDDLDKEDQIDITIIVNGEPFTIEVRSSFPYARIEEVITKHFSILGWYTTTNKPYEKPKDFYLRVLFPFPERECMDYLRKGFDLFFVGGATKELLDSKLGGWQDESMKQYGGRYRTIKPICKGYDARQILDKMFPNAKPEDFAGT